MQENQQQHPPNPTRLAEDLHTNDSHFQDLSLLFKPVRRILCSMQDLKQYIPSCELLIQGIETRHNGRTRITTLYPSKKADP